MKKHFNKKLRQDCYNLMSGEQDKQRMEINENKIKQASNNRVRVVRSKQVSAVNVYNLKKEMKTIKL
jgi:hypothetical protein